jgi:hypothetical protein
MSFSTIELIREVTRELQQRRRVYPRLVEAHTLSQKLADEQIAMMEQILAILRERDESERLI